MNEDTPPRAAWPDLVGVVAAAAVGLVVAARGFPLALFAAFTDLLAHGPMGWGVYAAAVLAVAIAVPALLPRLPGWPVAAAGLAVFLAADLTEADVMMKALLPIEVGTTREVAIALAATAGLGLALGGVLLALVQAAPAAMWWVGVGLSAGLVLHPVGSELFRAVLPRRAEHPSFAPAQRGIVNAIDVEVWLALGLVVVAAVVAYVRRSGYGPVASARFRPGAPVAVIAVAALLLLGFALRSATIRELRLGSDEMAGQDATIESFAQVSAVVLAVVVALLLTAYAYRLGRAPAARWVVLGAAAAPVAVFEFPYDGPSSGTRTSLVLLFGILAVAGGALAARHAARMLPWDAIGLVVVAAASPLAWPEVRAELPSADTVGAVLVAVGLGLAFGAGIVLVTDPAGTPPIGPAATVDGRTGGDSAAGPAVADTPAVALVDDPTGGRTRHGSNLAGVLVLGPAALMLCASALAPVVLRSQVGGLMEEDPSLTVPLFTTVGAVLLVLLFGFARAAGRLRLDPRAEAATSQMV
ncbi:hypothetical protein GCM10010169_60710 [Micromonospora fulviviridis]|uniref:hypothetical protein n=1 Tax=Micromonospora fulviviridis TaxID=47860 RepID=UPI00166473A8|nr:hypothetical protein [Micromonospora fulviviridis]GGS07699.1 hypothetical protein GCM10010169_60710 [Micromonospora fulviviridis]